MSDADTTPNPRCSYYRGISLDNNAREMNDETMFGQIGY